MQRFDTSTPIGKAMLMIVMVFAQLERETIQQRVIDAYRSRSRKGFYMGGRVPYGYELENIVMDGIKTCMYRPIPEQIQIVKLIYALYSQPQTSFSDVIKYLSVMLRTIHGIFANPASSLALWRRWPAMIS